MRQRQDRGPGQVALRSAATRPLPCSVQGSARALLALALSFSAWGWAGEGNADPAPPPKPEPVKAPEPAKEAEKPAEAKAPPAQGVKAEARVEGAAVEAVKRADGDEQPKGEDGEEKAESPPLPEPIAPPAAALPPGALARLGSLKLRHMQYIGGLAFCGDGKRLVSCGHDMTLREWDAATGDELRRVELPINPLGLQLLPGGKTLLLSLQDQSLRKLDAETLKETGRIQVEGEHVMKVFCSQDGKSGAAQTNNGLLLLDLETGAVRQKIALDKQRFMSAAFVADGQKLIGVGSDRKVYAYDAKDGKELEVFDLPDKAYPSAVALTPDGAGLAVGSWDKKIRFISLETGEQTMELPEKGTGVRHLIFSADGKRLVCGGNDGFVTVWEYPGKKQVQRFQASPQAVNQMELAPDGKTLAVSTQVISLWDAEAGKALVDPPGHASQIAQIAFGADRDRVLTGSNDGTVRLWSVEEARDPRKSGEAKVHRQRYRMAALSKDGALLALCGFDKTVKLLEAESGKEGAKLENLPGFPTALCFSPDGGRLAVASSNKQVHLYETKTGKKLADVAAPGQNVGSLAYAPDGSLFITASYDGAVGFFEAATGEAVCEYTLGRLSPNCLALSPDSRLLVTMGLGDGNNPLRAGAAGNGKAEGGQPGVRIVELASGQDVLLLQTPAPYQTGLAFLPGGKVLATAGMDGALRFWNMATGAELAKLEASPSDPAEDKELERLQAAGPAAVKMAMSRQFGKNRILCMAASADGTRLATGHQDTTALVWATPEAVLKAALPETAGDEEALKGLWGELSGEAGAAWAAVWKLAAGGEGAAKFLGRMLELAPPPEGELGQLLAQLDSDDVNQRDEASKKLELLGRAAESALRKAAEASESLEIKNRAKAVLAALESPTPSSPDLLRRARALAALERNGTPAAREILSRLAAGASESREARDAQGAMKRLGAAGDDKKE